MQMALTQTQLTTMEMEQKIEVLESIVDLIIPLLPPKITVENKEWHGLKKALVDAGYIEKTSTYEAIK